MRLFTTVDDYDYEEDEKKIKIYFFGNKQI